jgi:hypothetical protein
MAKHAVVRFRKGNKVCTTQELQAVMEEGPLTVYSVHDAPAQMPCSRAHPQILTLLKNDGQLMMLFGILATFPGSYFTKKNPYKRFRKRKPLPEEIIEGLNNLAPSISSAIEESDAVARLKASIRSKGYETSTEISLSAKRLKPLVRKNGTVPVKVLVGSKEDEELMQGLRIKVE